jgi:hypothetical protein
VFPAEPAHTIVLDPRGQSAGLNCWACSFRRYPRRVVLGLSLMGAQAFLYNAIFFTYALVLVRYYGVPEGRVGLFLLPFAAGNFLGPLVLGPLFDRIGPAPNDYDHVCAVRNSHPRDGACYSKPTC